MNTQTWQEIFLTRIQKENDLIRERNMLAMKKNTEQTELCQIANAKHKLERKELELWQTGQEIQKLKRDLVERQDIIKLARKEYRQLQSRRLYEELRFQKGAARRIAKELRRVPQELTKLETDAELLSRELAWLNWRATATTKFK